MMLYIGGLGNMEFLIVLIPFILWVWALIDVLKSEFKDGTTKFLWVLAIIFIPFIGLLLYFLIGRSQRLAT